MTIGRLNVIDIMTIDHFVDFRVPLVLNLSTLLRMAMSEDCLTDGGDIYLDWFMAVKLLLVKASPCSQLV